MPNITVIVPVYNVEKYLPCCIESILVQTVQDFEIILVDDGSSDQSGTICDSYAKIDSRIRVIHQENGGVSKARNAALNLAVGNYITFCDSDDYLRKDHLEQLLYYAQKYNADLVRGGYEAVDAQGNKLWVKNRGFGLWDIPGEKEKVAYIIGFLYDGNGYEGNGFEVCGTLFHADIIRQHNIQFCDTCGNFAEDLGFTAEYLLCCKKVCITESQRYCYFQREGSMMDRSRHVLKVDSLNEISVQVGKRFFKEICDKKYQKEFPLIHFLLMMKQYGKVRFGKRCKELPDEIKKIRNIKWHDEWTGKFRHCYRMSVNYFGKRNTQEYLLLANLCVHRNWKRYCLESAIAYKVFIKAE